MKKRNFIEKIIWPLNAVLATYALGLGVLDSDSEKNISLENYVKPVIIQKKDLEKRIEVPAETKFKDSQLSSEGIDLIREYEGFSQTVYLCPSGKPTIGYGHVILPDENYKVITREKAKELLLRDIKSAEDAVKKYVKVPLNQNQYDALVSFTYNLGEGNLARSTLLRKLNSGNYKDASEEFERWVYGSKKKKLPGLIRRRKDEKELFLK